MPITDQQANGFEQIIRNGGIAIFPTDTVYGLACAPDNLEAINRIYELKGRPPRQSAAVMFFSLAQALLSLPDLGPHTKAALHNLLPGPVTALLPNPHHIFLLACVENPEIIGLRVPRLSSETKPLAKLTTPVLQSSANLSGGPDPSSLDQVPAAIRENVDIALDGGKLPGVASTVIDLSEFEKTGSWRILREGAVEEEQVERNLHS